MHQFWKGKVACETTTFGGVFPDIPSHTQTRLDLIPMGSLGAFLFKK